MQNIASHNNDLSKIDVVIKRSGLSKTAIYRNIKYGLFPAPVRIGKRAVAWRAVELEKWLEDRPYALSGVKS